MIVKPLSDGPLPSDPALRAGVEAERQLAHYLHRAFAASDRLFVLHDLRIEDPAQPESTGAPGVCQIDHLIVHRFGVFIAESKSFQLPVVVQSDGSGGDMWTRVVGGRTTGIPSPIQQARRQGELLRAYLQRHREQLLGKVGLGMGLLAKALAGTDQRGFSAMPVQLIVAIGDRGHVTRKGGWREPESPLRTFVTKADQVPAKIEEQLRRHESASGLLAADDGAYGVWSMQLAEAARVADFLRASHTPLRRAAAAARAAAPSPAPAAATTAAPAATPAATPPAAPAMPAPPARLACSGCGRSDLNPLTGKYGCYWKCAACGANMKMPETCRRCGARRVDGAKVQVSQEGTDFRRRCGACGFDEVLASSPRR
ncbi:MAG: nuclease-related domain-containing protein [Phycisphaerales bacterium]